MLLTRSHALASAAFLVVSFAGLGAAGSDPTDLRTVLADLSSDRAPSTRPSTTPVGASEAVVLRLYPGLAAPNTGNVPPAANSGLATAAAVINPFVTAGQAIVVNRDASMAAANPFSSGTADRGRGAAVGSTVDQAALSKPFAIPQAPQVGSGSAGAASEAASVIDETALRYYAEQRNLERVGAEIRRLKALHPEWSPPADLFAPRNTVNEQPMWDLYGAGRIADARAMIAVLQKNSPDYRPSSDLSSKLDQAETRLAIDQSYKAGNWPAVLAAAAKTPDMLVCSEMNVLWQVGEAFAKSGDLARSFDLYGYVLANCTNLAERQATVEKAALVLPPQGLDALITHGQTLPNGAGEFDSMRFQPLRADIGKAIGEGGRGEEIDPARLAAFGDYTRLARSAPDAALLGWYAYGQERYDEAADWFALSGSIDPTPKAIEGTVLALRNGGKIDKARQIAFQARQKSPELAKAYVEIVADALNNDDAKEQIDHSELKRFEGVVEESRSALGAQTLGWHLVDSEDLSDAGDWFKKSVEWEPSEEAVVGLAVVASRTKDNASLKDIRSKWGSKYAALADFKDYRPPVVARYSGTRSKVATRSMRSEPAARKTRNRGRSAGGDKLMRQAQDYFDNGQYQQALSVLDKKQSRSGKTYGAEILRGWTNIKLKRWDQAEQIFRTQDARSSTKDTRFGIGAVQNSKYGMWSETNNTCTVKWKC